TVGAARSAKHKLQGAVRTELLDTVVAPVGNVDLPIAIHGNTPGHVELAGARAAFAPLQQELTVPGEFLHPVVHGVHHVDMALRIEGQTRGTVELSRTAALLAPFA